MGYQKEGYNKIWVYFMYYTAESEFKTQQGTCKM